MSSSPSDFPLISYISTSGRSITSQLLILLKKSFVDLFTLIFGPENEDVGICFGGFSAESIVET